MSVTCSVRKVMWNGIEDPQEALAIHAISSVPTRRPPWGDGGFGHTWMLLGHW